MHMYMHIFVTNMLLQLIVHDDYAMLNQSGSVELLYSCWLCTWLSTLFGILIPTICNVTENMMQLPANTYQHYYTVVSCVSNYIQK